MKREVAVRRRNLAITANFSNNEECLREERLRRQQPFWQVVRSIFDKIYYWAIIGQNLTFAQKMRTIRACIYATTTLYNQFYNHQ